MGIKLYHYRLKDIDKVITIECQDKVEARAWLLSIVNKNEELVDHPVVDEKIETPVSGVTEKTVEGKQFVWYSNGRNEGWMPKETYEKIILKK